VGGDSESHEGSIARLDGKVLFPVRIDDYLFTPWEHCYKPDAGDKVIGDFGRWDTDHAKYVKSFERLIECLQEA
jgi:hypothetical protein